MSFFGINFGGGAEIDIVLDDAESRKMTDVKDENGRKERFYLFYDGESVSGKVNITLHRKTGRLEHQGIRIEFIGLIELYYDRGNHHEFLSLAKELARPGELTQNVSFDFEFSQVEKPYETYTGVNVRLRYFLRVTMGRRLTDLTKELDLAVHTLATYPEMNNPIKMEVGIEECLHIEFEYNKSKYHLKDVIVGKIYFLLVRIKIKHMEIAIIKRETTGAGPNTYHENENIAKYEIMDGAPVRGESIPIRVFLAGYDLTPTMREINKKFSVRYYLNLVLVDEEDRRYFKQQEITLWRKGERVRKLPLAGSLYQQQQHALARHVAGDQPTEGVRTAPTPSLPPTPCLIDTTESRLPGGDVSPRSDVAVAAGTGDGGSSSSSDVTAAGENILPSAHLADGKEKKIPSAGSGDNNARTTTGGAADGEDIRATMAVGQSMPSGNEGVGEMSEGTTGMGPPDLVSGTRDLSLADLETDTDSTKDLDVVSVGGGGAAIAATTPTPPEILDSPPDMPSTPPEMLGGVEEEEEDSSVINRSPSSDLELPDAPVSEPSSPQAGKGVKDTPSSAAGPAEVAECV